MHSGSTWRCLLAGASVLTLGASVCADFVERRGSEPALEGVIDVGAGGVTVRTESGATHRVSWDRVRAIDTGDVAMITIIDRYEEMAAELWRARTRVERHDTALAEPILARRFEEFRGEQHETALVVAEGLLRCCLARGANDEAVIPALEVARLRAAGIETTSYAMLPPVMDDATRFCPHLPPVWIRTPGLRRAERRLEDYVAEVADPSIRAAAQLYQRSLRRFLELEEAAPSADGSGDDAGLAFLEAIVACDAADAETRRSARDRLMGTLTRADVAGTWREAWIRYAVGVSLLEEEGTGRQQRGLVQLLHLPARFGGRYPYLTGVALTTAASGCDELGLADGATTLRADLARRFPRHPVLFAGPERNMP